MNAAYDNDNIFAKILRGELPAHKVYEDEASLVFMDIMPRGDGHALIIPKNPSRNILDMAQADLSAVIATVQKVARAALKAFNAEGVVIQQFNEAASGQMVFHTHFHVIPRWADIPLKPPASETADPERLTEQAEKLRAALE